MPARSISLICPDTISISREPSHFLSVGSPKLQGQGMAQLHDSVRSAVKLQESAANKLVGNTRQCRHCGAKVFGEISPFHIYIPMASINCLRANTNIKPIALFVERLWSVMVIFYN